MTFARLRSSRDIRAVFAARKVRRGSALTAHVRDRGDDGPPRIAVVAGRKVGGAVTRNRAKRRLRAAAATVRAPAGADIVLVARSPAPDLAFPALVAELRRLVERPPSARGTSASTPPASGAASGGGPR